MAAKGQLLQRFRRSARYGAAAICGLSLMSVPVLAQFGDFGRPGFDSFFTPFSSRRAPVDRERSADYSHAPSPKKLDTQPTGGNILVFGDSMADWLGYGLEDALGDTPDYAVVRKNRTYAGLIRYDSRNENQDWPQVIREAIAQTKPKFVVMMIGLNDRGDLRDRVTSTTPAKGAVPSAGKDAPQSKDAAGQSATGQPAAPAKADNKADTQDAEQGPPDAPPQAPAEAAPKPGTATTTTYRVYDFHTDEWAAAYNRRIDATIAALKSAGVPVFWIGLPALRGSKSTSEMQYLDDLYRGRAEKAGITYIDVWDGFVDEDGRFMVQGPDFEGQTRRLRTGDGVYFTKAGARKLAHYLEREIRRVTAPNTEVVALPTTTEPQTPAAPAKPSGLIERPMAGPVVPLTSAPAGADQLIGANDANAPTPAKSVTRVLVKGEPLLPPAGRSDDFTWPRRSVAPLGADPIVATSTEPVPVMKPVADTTVAAPTAEPRPVAAAPAEPARRRTVYRAPPPQPQFRQPSFSFFSFGR